MNKRRPVAGVMGAGEGASVQAAITPGPPHLQGGLAQ